MTDKSVAQLVCLTAPWAGERDGKCSRVSGKAAARTHAQTHSHTLTHTRTQTTLRQENFPEESDLGKVPCICVPPDLPNVLISVRVMPVVQVALVGSLIC